MLRGMRKSHNRLALATLVLALAVSALFMQFDQRGLRLEVWPVGDGQVRLRLSNDTSKPVRLYNSLHEVGEGETPGFTTIRVRDGGGHVLRPFESVPEEFWTRDFTQTKKVPALLETLEPGGEVGLTTDVATLLQGYPDAHRLRTAAQVQVRCVVFLDKGVLEQHTEWFELPAEVTEQAPAPLR